MRRPAHRLALVCVLLALVAGIRPVRAEPNVLLFDATVDAARTLAVDSALRKGWDLVDLDAEHVTFEQVLEDDESGEAPLLLIRIHADFVEEASGTRVLLRAEEVELPDSPDEWVYDVTTELGDNLDHALSKLRARWDRGRAGADAADAEHTHRPPLPAGEVDGDSGEATVGTWAYYAERYAESRGCNLGDQGAVLEGSGRGWEDHRIRCLDGSVMHVRCRDGDCTGAQ